MIEKRILKCILTNLTDIYINIKNFPESEHFINELRLYNHALREKEKMNFSTIKTLINKSKYYSCPFYLAPFMFGNYNYIKAIKHIDAIIFANCQLIEKLKIKRYDQVKIMAASLHNYPNYLLGKYEEESDSKFYSNNILFYNKIFNEDFLLKYKNIFT
ncbi:MAG: hypothetical protein SOY42_05760 [Clostridium sp.]|nr:hypothetical protein [Clostridium sp.]